MNNSVFKSHPKGLYLLFSTEMWERFSYYGMRAMLVLYLTDSYADGGLEMSPRYATMLYGIFTGLVYFTPLIGGYLADKYLGQRKSIFIGGLIMMLGNMLLAAKQDAGFMYAGLALIVIGNGFFKPNISVIVGKLYPEGDKRIDSGFTLFYMGINLGGILAPFVTGILSSTYNYNYGFFAAGIGLLIGQIFYHLLENKLLGDIGKTPGITQKGTSDSVDRPLDKAEKDRISAIMVLTLFAIVFFAGMEQAGSSMTLFVDKYIDREIGGILIPTEWFMSINPAFVLIFAPVLSSIWLYKANKGKETSIPVKMAMGLFLLGIGFLALLCAIISMGGEANGHKANMWFMVLTFFLHTIGELYLSPVGLSMISKLSPVKTASLMMGFWFFASAFANLFAGYLASVGQSIGNFSIFAFLAIISFIASISLYLLRNKIRKLSHGYL